jgi:4-amino-4-deoxy-L-arabinose transferase-like glycosyltransferase
MGEYSRHLNRDSYRTVHQTDWQATLGALVAILILGAALRWAYLPRMTDMLSYDESYYAADAISLLNHFQLTPFFQGNQGRESGWIYILAAMMLGIGKTAFTAHLSSTFLGILSIAAVYRLGRELFNTSIGLWSAFGMAVLYWPMHFSVIAMRVNLVPFLEALSLALMLAARRKNRTRLWVVAGICIAALTYSYLAARLLIAFEMLILLVWYLRNRQQRRGIVIAAALAIVLSLPLVIYFIENPQEAVLRMSEAATIGVGSFIGALQAWANAWFVRGDYVLLNNSPNRPILDVPTGILFVVGLVGIWFTGRLHVHATRSRGIRQFWPILLIFGLAVVSLLPSLLSEYPPSFLRSIGLTVAIALVLGAGADTLTRIVAALARRLLPRTQHIGRRAWVVPMVALLAAGANSYSDFNATFLSDPGITSLFERTTHRAVIALQRFDDTSTLKDVYLTPYEMTNPIVQVSLPRLSSYHVGAFDPTKCLVISRSPSVYATPMTLARELQSALAWWGNVSTLTLAPRDPGSNTTYRLLELTPDTSLIDNGITPDMLFGDLLDIRTDLPQQITARGGDILQIVLRMRALKPLDKPYSVFVHLYSVDEGGIINDAHKWAQGDAQMCATYPTTMWGPDENVIQKFQLALPVNLPARTYVMAMGVYEAGPSGARLAVTHQHNSGSYSYVVLQHIQVNQ